ncbi:MAG: hypothetical protein FWD74_08520 [Actinomycetia bacterium]|nr:hypothetical protein [Actinomycetes bacterium]
MARLDGMMATATGVGGGIGREHARRLTGQGSTATTTSTGATSTGATDPTGTGATGATGPTGTSATNDGTRRPGDPDRAANINYAYGAEHASSPPLT